MRWIQYLVTRNERASFHRQVAKGNRIQMIFEKQYVDTFNKLQCVVHGYTLLWRNQPEDSMAVSLLDDVEIRDGWFQEHTGNALDKEGQSAAQWQGMGSPEVSGGTAVALGVRGVVDLRCNFVCDRLPCANRYRFVAALVRWRAVHCGQGTDISNTRPQERCGPGCCFRPSRTFLSSPAWAEDCDVMVRLYSSGWRRG
jgi:hypothetical protein